ncbi:MAG: DegV family EDD domain-containing protein [Oscillospiraceae bacterium]|nr:DegV family EDD domain-containing protein [Oscillospiraceae bacterium]
MSEWSIVVDSGCDLTKEMFDSDTIDFYKASCTITIEGVEYVDTDDIDAHKLLVDMEKSKSLGKTACPGPGTWIEELKKCGDKIMMITISDQVSGSYNSALIAKDMFLDEFPWKQVFVLNSHSCGPALSYMALKAKKVIGEDPDFKTVVEKMSHIRDVSRTEFAFCNFDNLVKGGRMNRIVGFVASRLNIWGVGASVDGGLKLLEKVRGETKMILSIMKNLQSREFDHELIIIEHCENEDLAVRIRDLFREKWPETEYVIVPTKGICTYYAERGGMIIHC